MRRYLVSFLEKIINPMMILGLGIIAVCDMVAYFTNASVAGFLLYNIIPWPLSIVMVGSFFELLRILLDNRSNEESEELL